MTKREMTAYYLAKAEKATHETTLTVDKLAQTYLKGCGCLKPLTIKEMNHRIKLYGFAK